MGESRSRHFSSQQTTVTHRGHAARVLEPYIWWHMEAPVWQPISTVNHAVKNDDPDPDKIPSEEAQSIFHFLIRLFLG